MHWTLEMLENVLELYKQQTLLMDSKHPTCNNKKVKDEMYERIANQLNVPNLTGEDVCRKLRTMRAAYQVEIRNINAAKTRGFYYKPTLKWFNAYKTCMDEIDAERYKTGQDSDDVSLEEEEHSPNTFKLKLNENKGFKKRIDRSSLVQLAENAKASHRVEIMLEEPDTSYNDDVYSDEESDDEFKLFADHLAEQLRAIPHSRVRLLRNQILRMFDKDRLMNKRQKIFISHF